MAVTLEMLQAKFKTDSPEEAILAASQRYRIAPEEIASEVGYDIGGKWGNRLGASIDNYQANLYGIAEAAGAGDWAKRGRVRNESAADLQRTFARNQGAVINREDIGQSGGAMGFVGDSAEWLGGLAIDSLPYIAEAAVGGKIAGTTARGLARLAAKPAAGAVVRGLSTAANAAPMATRTAGAVGAGYTSSVGSVLEGQREQNGTTDLGSALLLGVPYALLNAGLGIEGRIARGTLARNTVRGLDNLQGVRGGLARAGASAATTAATEGLAEAGQEVITQLGRMAVDPTATLTDPEAIERYKESLIGGAALGGAFGGAAGGWRRSAGYQPEKQPLPDQDADLLQNWQRDEIPAVNRKNPGFDPYAASGELRPAFELDGSTPATAPGETAEDAQLGPDPNQYDLFNPDGSPTYGADLSFGPTEERAPRTGNRGLALPLAPEAQAPASPLFVPREVQAQLLPEIAAKADAGQPLTPTELQILETYSSRQYVPSGPVDPGRGDGFVFDGGPTPQFDAPISDRPDFQLEAQTPDTQGELDFGPLPTEAQTPQTEFPGNNPMRRNQRGFIDDLPFAPPEAKIKTPLGQQLFTTADSLVQEGFMDEGTFDQVTTMLAQNKFGAAAKLVNGSLSARNDVQRTLDMTVGKAQEQQQKAQQEQVKQQEAAAQEAEKAATELGKKVLTEPMTTDGRTMDDIQRQVAGLEQQRLATLRADGRLPSQGTAKRKQHDALADQIAALKQEWSRLDTQAQAAKQAAPTGQKQTAKPAKQATQAQDNQAKVSKYERLIACLRP